MKSQIKTVGILTLTVIHKDGTKDIYRIKNLLTTIGLSDLAELLANNSIATPYSYLALGDGSTAPTPTDTALENELLRASATVTHLSAPDDTKVRYQAVWTVGNATGTYREAGIFNADSAGNMFNRATYADVVVGDTDALIANWDIDFQNI